MGYFLNQSDRFTTNWLTLSAGSCDPKHPARNPPWGLPTYETPVRGTDCGRGQHAGTRRLPHPTTHTPVARGNVAVPQSQRSSNNIVAPYDETVGAIGTETNHHSVHFISHQSFAFY